MANICVKPATKFPDYYMTDFKTCTSENSEDLTPGFYPLKKYKKLIGNDPKDRRLLH